MLNMSCGEEREQGTGNREQFQPSVERKILQSHPQKCQDFEHLDAKTLHLFERKSD
ncbi:MAG: hypothetical protein WA919_21740 [Coleofasciculaceae cyanobacterium]